MPLMLTEAQQPGATTGPRHRYSRPFNTQHVQGLVALSAHVNRLTASYARVSLATQRVEYSAAFFFKSLKSVYLSVSTHSYHQASSSALQADECERKEKEEGGEEEEALWTALICTQEHTWLLHRLMLHSVNTSGGAHEQTGSTFHCPISPCRAILLAGDKCQTGA